MPTAIFSDQRYNPSHRSDASSPRPRSSSDSTTPHAGCAVGIHEHIEQPLSNTTLSVPVIVKQIDLAAPESKWHFSVFIKRLYPRKSRQSFAKQFINEVFDETHVILLRPSTSLVELDRELRLRYCDTIERIFQECRAGSLRWTYFLIAAPTVLGEEQRVKIDERSWEVVYLLARELVEVRIEVAFEVVPTVHMPKAEQPGTKPNA